MYVWMAGRLIDGWMEEWVKMWAKHHSVLYEGGMDGASD